MSVPIYICLMFDCFPLKGNFRNNPFVSGLARIVRIMKSSWAKLMGEFFWMDLDTYLHIYSSIFWKYHRMNFFLKTPGSSFPVEPPISINPTVMQTPDSTSLRSLRSWTTKETTSRYSAPALVSSYLSSLTRDGEKRRTGSLVTLSGTTHLILLMVSSTQPYWQISKISKTLTSKIWDFTIYLIIDFIIHHIIIIYHIIFLYLITEWCTARSEMHLPKR